MPYAAPKLLARHVAASIGITIKSNWNVTRATVNRTVVWSANGNAKWMHRKLLKDATWHCRIALQVDWKRKCRRKGIFHSEPFLALLAMPWEQFARRLERQFKRRGWDWSDYGSEFTIDHRLPCCAFDLHKAEQRAMCSHWSNLQVLSLDENRRKNGNYSKPELRCYKTQWRFTFGRKHRQTLLFKESRAECKPICPF